MTVRLSDVIAAQEAMIEAQRQEREQLTALVHETLTALREWMQRPQRNPSETVELTRGTVGDHCTGIKVTAATQNGETLDDVAERARRMFESQASRYPMPSGHAHPWTLDGGIEAPPVLADALRDSVKGGAK